MAYGVTPFQEQKPSQYGQINADAIGAALAKSIQSGYVKPFQEPKPVIDQKQQQVVPAQPQPISFTPAAPAPDTFMQDMIKSINDLYDKRMSAGKTALTNTRDTELQGLIGQETTAHQGAYGARNSADAGTLQAMQRLREENARNGLLASGDNVTATTGLNVARENSLNAINQQENNIVQDISGKRSLVNNQAASKEMALLDEIEAQRLASQQDMMKYGDTREFRNREADRQQQLRELELAMQGKQANLNAALQVGDRAQRLISPTEDWGLLFQQPNAPLTPQGQSTQLQQAQVMATLTGRMPDGTATTAEQQRQLENLWNVAQQTGTIPDQLADLYKIQRGASTLAARTHALTAGNQRMNQLMDIWRNSGKAPAGLEELGVQQGAAYYDPTAARQANQGNTAEDYQSSTIKGIAKFDDKGVLSNPTQVEGAILMSPLSEYQKYKAYILNGMKDKWTGPAPAPDPSPN
jgi:hypothetical protein